MSAETDFLKPIPEQALRESELMAVRTLSAHIEQFGGIVTGLENSVRGLSTDMREVRDKVIQFEAANLTAQIAAVRGEMAAQASKVTILEMQKAATSDMQSLAQRVQSLENQTTAAAGAKSFAKEAREWMPYVFGLIGLAVFYFSQHPL